MKKYFKWILVAVMGLLLLAAALVLGYWGYSGKSSGMHKLSDVSEGHEQVQKELDALTEELTQTRQKLAAAEHASQELAALQGTFANGVVLLDYEVFLKSLKGPATSERQLGLGALRMLTKGADDPETISAFQQALDMTDWSSRLKSVCAAQNALAAAGQKVKVLADCQSE